VTVVVFPLVHLRLDLLVLLIVEANTNSKRFHYLRVRTENYVQAHLDLMPFFFRKRHGRIIRRIYIHSRYMSSIYHEAYVELSHHISASKYAKLSVTFSGAVDNSKYLSRSKW
jgi:hypothetical protein